MVFSTHGAITTRNPNAKKKKKKNNMDTDLTHPSQKLIQNLSL